MTDTMTAQRFANLLDEPVTLTFSDGGTQEGYLREVGWDLLVVEHVDTTGGGHYWHATYSLTGDADTPHVTAVDWIPTPAVDLAVPLF